MEMIAGMDNGAKTTGGILVCDDNRAILKLIVRVLEGMGYKTFKSETPEEALKIAQAERNGLILHIVDVHLPGMDGRKLRKEMMKYSPDAKCILLSGLPKECVEECGGTPEGAAFIQKPFSIDLLEDEIHRALAVDDAARTSLQ